MTIIFILAAWIGISMLVCLALAVAAARPMPHLSERGTNSHQAGANCDSSELNHGVAIFPPACSVG